MGSPLLQGISERRRSMLRAAELRIWAAPGTVRFLGDAGYRPCPRLVSTHVLHCWHGAEVFPFRSRAACQSWWLWHSSSNISQLSSAVLWSWGVADVDWQQCQWARAPNLPSVWLPAWRSKATDVSKKGNKTPNYCGGHEQIRKVHRSAEANVARLFGSCRFDYCQNEYSQIQYSRECRLKEKQTFHE